MDKSVALQLANLVLCLVSIFAAYQAGRAKGRLIEARRAAKILDRLIRKTIRRHRLLHEEFMQKMVNGNPVATDDPRIM